MHMENYKHAHGKSTAITHNTLNDKEIWIPLRRICPPRDEFECHETNIQTFEHIAKLYNAQAIQAATGSK